MGELETMNLFGAVALTWLVTPLSIIILSEYLHIKVDF